MISEEILETNKLQKTTIRIEMLNILRNAEFAVPENELRDCLQKSFDRTTIYRTLKTFLKKQIIHKIVEEDGHFSYVPDGKYTEKPHQSDDHIHFKCEQCGKVLCLLDTPIKTYNLPDGFIRRKNNFLILGTCDICSKKNKSTKN